MSIPKLSVSNPVLANLLMVAVIAFGIYAWIVLPRELTPEVKLFIAQITTIYPGASPEEVEKLITAPIEEEIESVSKIDYILSASSEGRSIITVQFEELSDREFDKRFQDLRSAVDRVSDLPDEILEEPNVLEIDMSSGFPMVTVVVGGVISEEQMKEIAENLRDEILDIKNIAAVRLAGVREREIWVEVDPDRLKAYHISLPEIISALKSHNLNLPAGTLEVGKSEYLVRTMGEYRSPQEIENTIIRIRQAGTPLRVGDVATVSDTYEKPRTLSRINGTRSVSLTVQKKKEGNTIKLVKDIRELLEKRKSDTPEGTEISAVNDYSVILTERLGILQNNALFGLSLVVVLLFLFLGWRNALFAALGIPVAFMATFMFMHLTGYSLSGVALFGLILVVGIVVDDAIVVVENVYRHIQEGMSPKEAAVTGAEEVGWPVLAGSLTTMGAFGPLLFMSGVPGQFMRIVPIVAILVLVASLFEVFMILPAHIAEWGKAESKGQRRHNWFNGVRKRYVKTLKSIIRWRYAVVFSVLIAGLILSIGAFLMLDKELFPGEDFPQFYIKAEMPVSFSIKETTDIIAQIEDVVMSISPQERIAIVSNIGLLTPTSSISEGVTYRSNVGEVLVELVPKDQRKRSVDEIIEGFRGKLAGISGIEKLTFDKLEGGPPQGKDVEVKVKGERFKQLEKIAGLLKDELHRMDGVYDIQDDFLVGKAELRIYVKVEKAHQYGLSIAQIAHNVRNALEGNITTTYRDADESIDVIVKYEDKSLRTIEDIEDLLITTPVGMIVPLRDVADIRREQGYAEIRRFEGERAITVSASVDKEKITAVEVNQALIAAFSDIESLYPGYRLDFRGVFDQIQESFADLWKLFSIGILLIYLILGTQFKSYIQPLIILCAVPFGIIGAMVGLLVVNATLSMVAMFGIVALAGIVVNDSIVLIDFINRYREKGYNRWRAILKGGHVRLRPIVLTTITTVFGLIPMATGLGGKSPIWEPLASTIIFGLSLATLMTLFVMPALYAITTDLQAVFAKREQPTISSISEEIPEGLALPADD
ncbi:efflux RND transporter permease subunit [Candidatus Poribacteria bacterium]|nr:efflux RND transporter permease subunit [Candidatus Poribacteria bacterium]